MSSILSGDTEENRTMDGGARDQIVRAVKMAMQDGGGMSADSREGEIVRTYLLVDLGAAMNYLRGRRGSSEATEALTDLAPEAELELESDESSEGGGMLSRLFVLGVVVGLGYAMSRRSESVGRAIGRVTDRAREVADETAMRSGEAAQRTEAVAGEAAERIEETGEMAADRVEQGGQEVSEDIEQAADSAEEAEQMAEERADEMSGDEDESDEESEE